MGSTTLLLVPFAVGSSLNPVLPSSPLGSWPGSHNNTAWGASARLLLPAATPGAGAGVSAIATATAQWWGEYNMLAQLLSPPLAAQQIAAANWTVAWAFQFSGSTAATWLPIVYISLVNGATGTVRTTIKAITTIGITRAGVASPQTVYSAAVSGTAATAVQDDYLDFELGVYTGASVYGNYLAPSGGTTIPTSDAASLPSPQAALICPNTLYFIPYAGNRVSLQGGFLN
jgi:hypothetical protein